MSENGVGVVNYSIATCIKHVISVEILSTNSSKLPNSSTLPLHSIRPCPQPSGIQIHRVTTRRSQVRGHGDVPQLCTDWT